MSISRHSTRLTTHEPRRNGRKPLKRLRRGAEGGSRQRRLVAVISVVSYPYHIRSNLCGTENFYNHKFKVQNGSVGGHALLDLKLNAALMQSLPYMSSRARPRKYTLHVAVCSRYVSAIPALAVVAFTTLAIAALILAIAALYCLVRAQQAMHERHTRDTSPSDSRP